MSTKIYAKIVIAAGFLLMMYARSMDVTYNGVINLHLISRQNTTMMLGGFVFLGGLILYAVARIKQTPDDERRESNKRDQQWRRGSEIAKDGFSGPWRFVSNYFSRPRDMRTGRLLTGMIVGLSLGLLALAATPLGGAVVYAFIILLAYRDIPARKAIRQLLGVHTFIYGALAVTMMLSSSLFTSPELEIIELAVKLIPVLPAAISAYFYWQLGKQQTYPH
jgi:hypothetical protein